jgi:hypothetical protein
MLYILGLNDVSLQKLALCPGAPVRVMVMLQMDTAVRLAL